jgi:hypothetical protein
MTEKATAPGSIATAKVDGRRGAATRQPQPQGGAVYGLGMIGALVYFAGTAQTGKDYALAVAKATVWPALMVYRVFRFLDR